MNLIIVEDHHLISEMLCRICGRDFGHQIVGQATNGREAVSAILRTLPDLVILDLGLPDFDGFEVIRQIRAKGCLAKIVIVSAFCDADAICEIERASVHGFVDKSGSPLSELKQAFEAISAGDRYFSRRFRDLRSKLKSDPQSFDKMLSNQERTVLKLIGHLLPDSQIARNLEISIRTVEYHRSNIMRKLGLPNLMALLRYAREMGFGPRDPVWGKNPPLSAPGKNT